VPTGIAAAPDGGVYVGFLTALPCPDGTAKVAEVHPDGTITDVWTGLTTVTDVAVGPDGTLYAAEMTTGNQADAPFYHPGTGTIVRQTGPDQAEEIATGLDFPIALGIGPDGALYVASPAIGTSPNAGTISRIALTGGTPTADASDAPAFCA
jgi:hypothetical protein